MNRERAHNKCCSCGHEWYDYLGMLAIHEYCPECGSSYWEWLNFNEDKEEASS